MDPIGLSGLSIADPSPPQSDQATSGEASPLSPKLRDKLNKLAKWRIDPSLIEFPVGSSECKGGHATVSRALLTLASPAGADLNESKDVEGGPNTRDGPIKKKVVAVKKLKTENGNSSERVLEMGLREAGFLGGLSSPYIIELDGFVEDLSSNRIWLIFPWEEHGNLKDFVASQDWEIPERIWLIDDVTKGVEYLHSLSPPVYHGDLKSINVLVTSECRAVITDFGSARRLTKKDVDLKIKRTETEAKPELGFQATFCATSNTMTFTGNEYTLRWAAPELLMDDEPGLSSDIWALGWIFYEVMTNSIPFENLQKDSMVIKHVIDGKLPCVTDHIRMSLILQLCSVMIKCWNIDSIKRPTAEDCRKSLNWMPMVVPVPQRSSDQAISRSRSPKLLMKLGNMYKAQSECINASKLYTEALNIYTGTSDNSGMADALYSLGQVHWAQSEYSKAETSYSKALEISTEIGDRQRRSGALWGLATVHCNQKEYSKAMELYSKVIQISISLDDHVQRADALRGLAQIYELRGDYDQAVALYSDALEIYSNIGNMFGRTIALAGLATVLRRQFQYSEAFALFSESLQISTGIGDKFVRACALSGLAHIHRDQDRYHDALCLYEEAAEIWERIGHTGNASKASRDAAHVRSKLGVQPVNTAYCARALSAYTASPDDPDEISFSKGEILEIVDISTKWWQARKQDGTTGIAPSNYLLVHNQMSAHQTSAAMGSIGSAGVGDPDSSGQGLASGVEPLAYAYRARALYAYTASPDDPDEISLSKGEILEIVDISTKWWQARKQDGTTGIAPSNYLLVHDDASAHQTSAAMGSIGSAGVGDPDSSGRGLTSGVEPTGYAYRATALHAYTASPDDPHEISFSKGEILEIFDNSGKWWQARKQDGTTGIVPSNYLQRI